VNRARDLDAQLDGDARAGRLGQRYFPAVLALVQFFWEEPTVPGGHPQQFHHLIPVRV
jgi:hypothetical protein